MVVLWLLRCFNVDAFNDYPGDNGPPSLCAWANLGWRAVGFSEIEPFPCAVLSARWGASRPWHMPQLGHHAGRMAGRKDPGSGQLALPLTPWRAR